MQTRFFQLCSVIALATGCLSGHAAAQSRPYPTEALLPPPLEPHDISLDLARQGVEAALAECLSRHDRVVAEVVDREGTVKVLMVADGASRRLLKTAQNAAHTVLTRGMSSGDFGRSFGRDITKMVAATKADPDLGLNPGAVPIMRDGVLVGAISVAGTSLLPIYGGQEPCAVAGRDKIEAGFKSQNSN